MYLAEVCILSEIPFFQAYFFCEIYFINIFVYSDMCVGTEIKILVLVLS